MKFYDREYELQELKRIRQLAFADHSHLTVVTGRRRIGKTSLIMKSVEQTPTVYLFVSRRNEAALCAEFVKQISSALGVYLPGTVVSFGDLFRTLLELATTRSFNLVIDEFQEFFNINESIYSDMQRIWDIYSSKAHVNLIVCGSIYSMMTKIFKDRKEPLYNRQTRFMTVRPFTPTVLKEILAEYHPGYMAEDLLALYSFTGGIAKYVQLLIDAGATTKEKMLDQIVKADSIFLGEGKAILIEEFGKDYGVYFSILSAIARGKNSRSEIERVVGREIGGYLTKLENEYEVIAKKQPLFEKSSTKNVRYTIEDNFFTFWFRFIYKYSYMLEIENYESVKTIINRDYETFSGLMLERYFRRVLIGHQTYTRIGGWWDRKGENEIDIVAEDELNNAATFFEVKRKARNINLDMLKQKADTFLRATGEFKGYTLSYKGLSMDDM